MIYEDTKSIIQNYMNINYSTIFNQVLFYIILFIIYKNSDYKIFSGTIK